MIDRARSSDVMMEVGQHWWLHGLVERRGLVEEVQAVTESDCENKRAIQVVQDQMMWKTTSLLLIEFDMGDLLGMWCRTTDVATSGFEQRRVRLEKQTSCEVSPTALINSDLHSSPNQAYLTTSKSYEQVWVVGLMLPSGG